MRELTLRGHEPTPECHTRTTAAVAAATARWQRVWQTLTSSGAACAGQGDATGNAGSLSCWLQQRPCATEVSCHASLGLNSEGCACCSAGACGMQRRLHGNAHCESHRSLHRKCLQDVRPTCGEAQSPRAFPRTTNDSDYARICACDHSLAKDFHAALELQHARLFSARCASGAVPLPFTFY